MKKPDLPPALSCLLPCIDLFRSLQTALDHAFPSATLEYHEQLFCGHRAEVGVVDQKWMQIVTDTFKQG
jgi:hypothetical protein